MQTAEVEENSAQNPSKKPADIEAITPADKPALESAGSMEKRGKLASVAMAENTLADNQTVDAAADETSDVPAIKQPPMKFAPTEPGSNTSAGESLLFDAPPPMDDYPLASLDEREPLLGKNTISPTAGIAEFPYLNPPQIENWPFIVKRLKLDGLSFEIVRQSGLVEWTNEAFKLSLPSAQIKLVNPEIKTNIQKSVADFIGAKVTLEFIVDERKNPHTLGFTETSKKSQTQQNAVKSIESDPHVKALQKIFGAKINPDSIKPKEQK